MAQTLIETYVAFLKKTPSQLEQVTSTGNELMCGGSIMARWESDVVVVVKKSSPSKKQVQCINGLVSLATQLGITVRIEKGE